MFVGNAYEAKDVRRVPSSLHRGDRGVPGSTVAREVFGDFVFEHLLNTAVQEQIIYETTVWTDWELHQRFTSRTRLIRLVRQPAANVGFSAKYTSR